MKKPFSVGDRIRAYDALGKMEGAIDCISGDGSLRIKKGTHYFWYHPKQCRKLKPKQKKVAREWFMVPNTQRTYLAFSNNEDASYAKSSTDQIIHVREVLP